METIQLTLKRDVSKEKCGTARSPNIIRYFEKTPPSIVCPHFWQLNWAYGCNFDCAYCYLKGTFRGNTEPRHMPIKDVLFSLDQFFKNVRTPSVFNSGELADSFIFPSIIETIADKFEEQNVHKLLLLTKSCNVDFLVKKPRKQTIVSFSTNAPEVSRRWENKTPSPLDRIEAAKRVKDAGYEVRIRIDPIFPISNWQNHYGKLLKFMLSELTPERITLGTPRGLRKTLLFSKDLSWAKYFTEDSGWGKKIPTSLRKEIYLFIHDELERIGFDTSKIALCKETIEMWEELGWDYKEIRCNCVW